MVKIMDNNEHEDVVGSEWKGLSLETQLWVSALRPTCLGLETQSRVSAWDRIGLGLRHPVRGSWPEIPSERVSAWDRAGLGLRPHVGPRPENLLAVGRETGGHRYTWPLVGQAAMVTGASYAGAAAMVAAANPAPFLLKKKKMALYWACQFLKVLVFF